MIGLAVASARRSISIAAWPRSAGVSVSRTSTAAAGSRWGHSGRSRGADAPAGRHRSTARVGSSSSHAAPAGERSWSVPSRSDHVGTAGAEREVGGPAEAARAGRRVDGERAGGQVGDDGRRARRRGGRRPGRRRSRRGRRPGACALRRPAAPAARRRPARPPRARPGRARAARRRPPTLPSAASSCSASNTDRSATADRRRHGRGRLGHDPLRGERQQEAGLRGDRLGAGGDVPALAGRRRRRARRGVVSRALATAVEPPPQGITTSAVSARSPCSRDRVGPRSGSGPPASQPSRAPTRSRARTTRSVAAVIPSGADVEAAEVDHQVAADHDPVGRPRRDRQPDAHADARRQAAARPRPPAASPGRPGPRPRRP